MIMILENVAAQQWCLTQIDLLSDHEGADSLLVPGLVHLGDGSEELLCIATLNLIIVQVVIGQFVMEILGSNDSTVYEQIFLIFRQWKY